MKRSIPAAAVAKSKRLSCEPGRARLQATESVVWEAHLASHDHTAATDRELQRFIGARRLVPVEIRGRRALIQLLDDDIDLDHVVERNPVAAEAIEQGLADVEADRLIDHDEVVAAARRS